MQNPKKIMVVDDSSMIRKLIRTELTQDGFLVIEAADGLDALNKIQDKDQIKSPPDLITLDIDMPKMNGFATFEKIQGELHNRFFAHLEKSMVPVIFITANDNLKDRSRGYKIGAADFITKPFKPGVVLNAVNKILNPNLHLKGLTALVVDDNKVARGIVVENLKREGLVVIQAGDGVKAFEIMKEKGADIDIVITDLVMPKMDGEELCKKIRRELDLKDIPIIFLTAMSDLEKLLSLFTAGATDYLVKPFIKEELMARLSVHLERTMLTQKLKHSFDELQRMEKEKSEQEKMKTVWEMAGAICHELNQPLQALMGQTDMLVMTTPSANPIYKSINAIKDQIDRIGAITKKLMNLTHYETKEYAGSGRILDLDKSSENKKS